MVDFTKLMKTPVSDIKPAPQLPVGTYLCRVGSFKTNTKTINNEDRGIFTFQLTVVEPKEDVEQEAIDEFGGLGVMQKYKLKHDIFVGDNDNLSAVLRFATETCKVEQQEGQSLDEVLNETNGAFVLVSMQHIPRKKGEGVVAVIDKVISNED